MLRLRGKFKDKMINKLKNFFKVEHLAIFAFLFVAASLVWSTIKVIEKNYDLQQEVYSLEDEVELLDLENQNLKLSIAYYKSDGFLELEAREKFNKVAAGEKVLILPKNTSVKIEDPPEAPNAPEPETKTNFDAWLDFLMGRGIDSNGS